MSHLYKMEGESRWKPLKGGRIKQSVDNFAFLPEPIPRDQNLGMEGLPGQVTRTG